MPEHRRFVVGDIHGCIRTFTYLIERILRLERGDTLFLIGDVIDRGPASREVLDYIINLSSEITVRPTLGNHEYLMLKALENDYNFGMWTLNGSAQTLLSFGIDRSKVNDWNSVSLIPSAYIDLLKSWPLYEETEDFLFIHAGLDEFSKDPLEDIDTLLWTRNENASDLILKGRKLIHGHTPAPLSSILRRFKDPEAQVFNIDGGCVYKMRPGLGYLLGLDLDNWKLHSIRNRD
jgi:serine/threonine protein phosphatase 1